MRRNCSSEKEFVEELGKLRTRLLERGYTKSCMQKAFNKVRIKYRQETLFFSGSKIQENPLVRFITKCTSQHQEVRQILGKLWGLLTTNEKVGLFLTPNPQITFRKSHSIRDNLVASHYMGNGRTDSCKWLCAFPCEGCTYCVHLQVGTRITL